MLGYFALRGVAKHKQNMKREDNNTRKGSLIGALFAFLCVRFAVGSSLLLLQTTNQRHRPSAHMISKLTHANACMGTTARRNTLPCIIKNHTHTCTHTWPAHVHSPPEPAPPAHCRRSCQPPAVLLVRTGGGTQVIKADEAAATCVGAAAAALEPWQRFVDFEEEDIIHCDVLLL